MNQDQEDEKIWMLFQRLKEEDERNASPFVRDWNAALSKMDKPRQSWAFWQMAAGAAALLMLLGAGSWILFRQSAMEQAPTDIVRSNTPALASEPPASLPQTLVKSDASEPEAATRQISPTRLRVNRRSNIGRQRSGRSQPMVMLNSQWRSPTESLLDTPGRQLFKKVPRLDDSVVNIKATTSR
jgi:cytoskeletal protein RodZ